MIKGSVHRQQQKRELPTARRHSKAERGQLERILSRVEIQVRPRKSIDQFIDQVLPQSSKNSIKSEKKNHILFFPGSTCIV